MKEIDYDVFVEKFNIKKTTDDCYTPPDVYDCVLNYVSKNYNIEGFDIVRPFYPGGDYENYEYPERCIVIDNPPFSIISMIVRFFLERDILFFLFAPHLTLFSSNLNCTRIVTGAAITYKNGARVKTSFLSNLFGDIGVISDFSLYKNLENINNSKKVSLPKYQYPPNVLTVSMLQRCLEKGISMKFSKNDIYHIGKLDCQNNYKKAIFGSGFLLSEKAAAEKAAAEKAAAEKNELIVWELSEREKEIIKSLK